MIIVDDGDCLIELHEAHSLAAADATFAELQDWSTFARDRALGAVARRETCAFGEPGLSYRYSGTTKTPGPWPPQTEKLAYQAAEKLRCAFNFCLANRYPDRHATIGWHRDDERDLEAGAPIAIVSLGGSRVLGLQRDDGTQHAVMLEHGSMLVMAGATQQHWRHCIIRGTDDNPRISLTLRRVRRPS